MATVSLTSVLDTWPAGTTVGAYLQSNQSAGWDRASTPTGAAPRRPRCRLAGA
jgi:hypothetical protein